MEVSDFIMHSFKEVEIWKNLFLMLFGEAADSHPKSSSPILGLIHVQIMCLSREETVAE